MLDAIREVAKNKYYWIIQSANWVVFLEGGYGVVLGWSFVYAYQGQYEPMYGLANTIIGNSALWSMLLAPFAIKAFGKRNLLIAMNTINIFVLIGLYFVYRNILLICILSYLNMFVNTFWNIIQHNINADMRDYHQWKTGVRVDGLFGPLGMIGTVIGLFTGMVYPTIYEKMGLLDDHSVLYNDTMRNNLFEVLILFSALGAFLNLIPFLFYDLTENKHKAYVSVLKIRTMFENYSLGEAENEEIAEAMELILQAKELNGKEKAAIDKTALKNAKRMPKATPEEKELRSVAIKSARKDIRNTKEQNLAIERAPIIMEDLDKFSTKAGKLRISQAETDIRNGILHYYENAQDDLINAKSLPKKTKEEKEIRSDAIKNARIKKEASSLIRKYGVENLIAPDEKEKQKLLAREHKNFFEAMKTKQEIRVYLKNESVYRRAIKPYTEAEALLSQAKYYSNYDNIFKEYQTVK